MEAVGQIIGVVIANTTEAARRAAQKVIVKYAPLPAVISIEVLLYYEYFWRLEFLKCSSVSFY